MQSRSAGENIWICMNVIRQYHQARKYCIRRSFIIFTPPSIIRMRQTGHAARFREMKNGYKILIKKPECKKPLTRYKYCHALGDRRRGIGLTIGFITVVHIWINNSIN
jgi:hypothetical protein